MAQRFLLSRLDESQHAVELGQLQLLIGGARDLAERQQTLRNTITWSYDLLSEEERGLFQRLAVFVGGYQLEAVEEMSRTLGESTVPIWQGVSSPGQFRIV